MMGLLSLKISTGISYTSNPSSFPIQKNGLVLLLTRNLKTIGSLFSLGIRWFKILEKNYPPKHSFIKAGGFSMVRQFQIISLTTLLPLKKSMMSRIWILLSIEQWLWLFMTIKPLNSMKQRHRNKAHRSYLGFWNWREIVHLSNSSKRRT